jgi:eukaryotic-like serine/threonine-protein kinase
MGDRIGQQLGNYRLLRQIGQGGFADVYLGEHIHLGTQAAVKVLHTQVASEDIESFRSEARTIAQLEHPNIVRVLEFGLENGIPFLVMSYAPNGNLRQRHEKGISLPISTIVSYSRQVASALQYAHNGKLIHRDVKPENMLVGRHNEILLSDFGIALIAQSTSSQSKKDVTGTFHYMAPEQLRGRPRPASDQYALGIVVYEWLCGYRPFNGSFAEIAAQHMFAPPPSLRGKNSMIPPDIEQVVMMALAKEPQHRFASVQAFATALEQASLPSQRFPGTSPGYSQSLPPVTIAAPPTQHYWPTPATLPSNQPSQVGIITPPSVAPLPPKRSISRRTVMASIVGLAGVSVVGAGVLWFTRSRASYETTVTLTPTATPMPTPIPTPLGTTFYTYHGQSYNIRVLAWSPNGQRIASGSDDNTAHVWGAATGNNPTIYRGHSLYVEGVAWSPDSKRIASGSADTTVQIWDPATGNTSYIYRGHSLWVNRVSWSPNGKYIASGEQASTGGHTVEVRVWEAATGNTIVIYKGHTNGVFTVAWSPDGTRIASCGYDGTLQVWEAATGNPIATYHSGIALFGLSWSPDGKHIVVGGNATTAWVLDAKTGSSVYTYDVHSDQAPDVAWSPDGIYIAAGSNSQTVHLLKAATGEHIYTYDGQSGHIDAVVWSPDSKRVASGSNNGTVNVWQAA